MPVVHPADIWRASGRYDAIGPELTRFKDRNGRDMVLAMTHEEVVGILLADIVKSYRQLPMQVYHFQTKWRDEPRARGGPDPRPRVRHEGRLQLRPRRGRARRQLPGASTAPTSGPSSGSGSKTVAVSSRRRDHGRQPGPRVHGPQPRRRGRPRPVRGVRLRREPPGRRSSAGPTPAAPRSPLPLEEVATPGTTTIATLAAFLGIDPSADRQGRLLRDRRRPARDGHRPRRPRGQRDQARQRRRGAIGGHPAGDGRGDQGRGHGARLRLADRRPRHGRGRRRPRRPLAEPGRRREPRGLPLPQRQRRARLPGRRRRRHHERPGGRPVSRPAAQPVILRNGIEVGNIFKLGTKFTDAFGATYLGEDGQSHPIVMGSYGIGVGRNVGVHRRGPPRRQGHRLAGRGRALRGPPRVDRRRQGAARRRDRRAPPRPGRGRRPAPRDPLGRPRRVARGQVHRRRAARACPGS